MRKFYLLFALLISFSSAAWADFDLAWTNAPSPWSSTAATDVPEGVVTTTSGTKHVGISRHVVKSGEAGDVSVTFEYKSGNHALRILGVDLVNAEGAVVKSAYEEGTVGSAPNNIKTYTLSSVDPGTYSLRYWVCNATSNSNDITQTNGVITVAGLDRVYITSLSELKNDKIYTIKSGRSGETSPHYLLYHTAATENLSSTYGSGHAMGYSDDATNFQFAIYKSGDAYYMYNIAANKFVGNANDNNATVPMVKVPSNAVYFKASTVEGYNWVLSTNNFVGALNAAGVADKHGLVNWTGGKDNTTDGGNVYQIMEVGDLSAEKQTYISNMIAWSPKYWEAYNIASHTNYVGGLNYEAGSQISAASVNFYFSPTTDNYNTLVSTLEAQNIEANKATLSAGEIFQIQCSATDRGYLAYSTVDGNGSETNAYIAGATGWTKFPTIDAEGIYSEWAFVEKDSKKYIYNVQNQKFISPSGGIIAFDERGAAYVQINAVDGSPTEHRLLFNNSSSTMLSLSPGYDGINAVRTYDNANDGGVKFYLIKTGSSVETSVAEAVAAKLYIKDNLNTKLAKGRLMGEGLGHYTYSGSENAAEIIATAEGLLTSGTATTEQINASITALDGIYANFSLNMPEVGKLYRFKGIYSGNYISPTASSGKMAMNDVQTAPATVFMLTEGNKLLSCNTGYYTTDTHSMGATNATANTVTFLESTDNLGYYKLQSNASEMGQWFYDNSSSVDGYPTYSADRCDWAIEEITWLPVPVS